MLGRIAQARCLQLSHWSSVGTMSAVLLSIKELLACHARVDVASPRNDPGSFPEGQSSHPHTGATPHALNKLFQVFSTKHSGTTAL